MTVTPPDTWGKLDGTITGLGRCDTAGGPLAKADIDIVGVTTLVSATDGTYVWWLEQGTYTLNVTNSGYISQSIQVDVTPGSTATNDFDLRLDAPCGAAAPASFEATAIVGSMITQTLTLSNTGAGGLSFQILELTLSLPPTSSTLPGGGTAVQFSEPVLPGVASVLLRAVNPPPDRSSPQAPDFNWYAALDLPGGLVRYAAAQCYSQPSSFYVTSGINGNFSPSTKTWRYDADSNTWTELAPIPNGAEAPSAVCYQGKIYVMGGSGTNQFYIYEIASDTWSDGPPLPRNVEGAAAGAWDGKIFLVGGDDDFYPGSGVSDEVDIFDIASGTWSGLGMSIPVPTSNAGVVATGRYLYVVGGWGIDSPNTNVNATQRYDMTNNEWQIGPEFTSARADLALAATSESLYAIGGDANGGFFFDATATVGRLDLSTWPGGSWADLGDPLPAPCTSNSAGFCTPGLFPSQVWSVGGFDPALSIITGENRFLGRPGESCYSIYSDVPWLMETPASGVVTGDSVTEVPVIFDASNLSPGVYTATLVLLTNEPALAEIRLPVQFTVVAATYGLSLSPIDITGMSAPGTTIIYTLQVTNTGNIVDTYSLDLTGNTWSVDASASVGPLLPNSSTTLSIGVSVPTGTANGASDAVTLTLTSQADSATSASSTITTIAAWYRSFMPVLAKLQSYPDFHIR